MNRRDFVGVAGTYIAGAPALPGSQRDDTQAIRQAVEGYYADYPGFDKAKYRACLTDDSLLLENGELLDIDGDLAIMASAGSGYQRTDVFDFRVATVRENLAYAVYFLTSDISDQQGSRHRERSKA